jgi:hypothetical protein
VNFFVHTAHEVTLAPVQDFEGTCGACLICAFVVVRRSLAPNGNSGGRAGLENENYLAPLAQNRNFRSDGQARTVRRSPRGA